MGIAALEPFRQAASGSVAQTAPMEPAPHLEPRLDGQCESWMRSGRCSTFRCMAEYDVQVVLQGGSQLPEDQFVNVLHYEIGAPDTIEGTVDDISAAYAAAMLVPVFGDVEGVTIKVYEPGPNPTGPVFTKSYPTLIAGSVGPHEVAVCLSYATADDPDRSTPRRRGRIYVGPIAAAHTDSPRPSSALLDGVLALGQGLASAGNASNSTWLMYSSRDAVYEKIESIWVDDAWDTQRRRGLAPTTRTVQDVQ